MHRNHWELFTQSSSHLSLQRKNCARQTPPAEVDGWFYLFVRFSDAPKIAPRVAREPHLLWSGSMAFEVARFLCGWLCRPRRLRRMQQAGRRRQQLQLMDHLRAGRMDRSHSALPPRLLLINQHCTIYPLTSPQPTSPQLTPSLRRLLRHRRKCHLLSLKVLLLIL